MKFLVEIDTATKAGTEAINYLRELKTSQKSVYIRKISGKVAIPVSPEEMALPFGKKPTQKELDEFLDRKEGKGTNIETVRKRILKNIGRNKKRA